MHFILGFPVSLSVHFLYLKFKAWGEDRREKAALCTHIPPPPQPYIHKLYICRLVLVNLETDAAVVIKTY